MCGGGGLVWRAPVVDGEARWWLQKLIPCPACLLDDLVAK